MANIGWHIAEEENALKNEGTLQEQWTKIMGKLKTESPAQWVSEELEWLQRF